MLVRLLAFLCACQGPVCVCECAMRERLRKRKCACTNSLFAKCAKEKIFFFRLQNFFLVPRHSLFEAANPPVSYFEGCKWKWILWWWQVRRGNAWFVRIVFVFGSLPYIVLSAERKLVYCFPFYKMSAFETDKYAFFSPKRSIIIHIHTSDKFCCYWKEFSSLLTLVVC